MFLNSLEIKHLAIVLSVLGISTLYIISTLSEPTNISLEDIENFEGKIVTTKGFVTDTYETTYGSQIITIRNNNYSAKVFLEGKKSISYGDKIQVTGEVQKYNEEWEIIVENPKFIKIYRSWQNNYIPLEQIGKNPKNYENINIKTSGIVEIDLNDYFYLIDVEDEYKIPVYHDKEYITLHPNQKVEILGKFKFDEKELRYKISIENEEHCINIIDE